jgi:Zn-finger in ubiquitin-hydrolases and other protein
MNKACKHTDQIRDVSPSGPGCVECLANDGWWVQLRRCAICGHIGCCDSSPNKHATKHAHVTGHPIIQSYEPNEDWLWCYIDKVTFDIPMMSSSPSHPPGWSPGPPRGYK